MGQVAQLHDSYMMIMMMMTTQQSNDELHRQKDKQTNKQEQGNTIKLNYEANLK
jgi:hypothetical protein